MVSASLISIIILVAVVLIIYKITKTVLKTIMTAFSLFTILLLISVYMMLTDIKDVQANFAEKPNMFILQRGDSLVSGFVALPGEGSESVPQPLSESELEQMKGYYSSKDYNSMLGENYKLFVIDYSAFDDVEIKSQDDTITGAEIRQLMDSNSPIDDYINMKSPGGTTASQKAEMRTEMLSTAPFKDDSEFKSFLFSMMLSSAMESQGPSFLFVQQQHDKLIVYPETMAFKALKYMPEFLLNKFVTTQGEQDVVSG